MSILPKLQNNKGTVSSALGKSLAQVALKGDLDILKEAIELVNYDDKNVRSGAGKIIEMVAEKRPDLVAPYIEKIFPALEFPEPQTRWMVIHILGLCAQMKPEIALKAYSKAEQFLNDGKSGMCLWDRSITYLGYIGALSEKQADKVFPVLEKCMIKLPERNTRIFEGFERMIPVLNDKLIMKLKVVSEKYANEKVPSVKAKAKKLLKLLSKK